MSGYLSFYRTGNEKFDAVLSAIEDAGDAFHHTSEWSYPCDQLDGKSYLDIIDKLVLACNTTQ